MSKRFLVTGATGFVGANLVRRLVKNGDEVHILTRQESNKWRIVDILDQVTEHQVDLRDRFRLQSTLSRVRPDIVYHCAAYGAYSFQQDAIQIAEVNLMGTVNLVMALMEVGYECLINTGSSSEYGRKAKPMAEGDLLEPITAYAATKAAATLFCQAIARSRQQPILTLRLFSPYGPYEDSTRLIPAVIKKCLAGEALELSSGEEARDFFFVDDLVDLYLRVASLRWSPGDIVNVGSGKQHTVREIVNNVIALTGANVRPLWGALPPRDFDTKFWVADITKAKLLFDWTPKVSLDEGLRRTIEWQRASNKASQQL
ncbi:MAG: NAD-dependent dehydratase [Deltaproteobacteria bacterium]|mgnify:CR=1 FL=1|nr:MAG: NAD-dependent dehydratase [Deltaproteobacteria bacterium]